MALIGLARHGGRSTSQAPDSINRQLRSQISDADLVVGLYADDGSERREPASSARWACSAPGKDPPDVAPQHDARPA